MSKIIEFCGGLKLYAVAAGAAVLAVLAAFWRVREDGKNSLLIEQQRRRDALQAEFDRIDADAPNLNASLARMRRGSNPK